MRWQRNPEARVPGVEAVTGQQLLTVTMALTRGFTDSIRSRWARTISTGEISFVLICLGSSVALE